MNFKPTLLLVLALGACSASEAEAPADQADAVEEWRDLFNGQDLTGWVPKITGKETGEDPLETFRVEDGLLTVSYENYEQFDGQFGHLFFEESFGDYHLKVEYRFIGDQLEGGPGWAFRNSGVMFHSLSPASMMRDQDFPISVEAEFLGGPPIAAGDEGQSVEEVIRPTANLCSPGTHVEMGGELIEDHCVDADAPTFPGDQWVLFELIARGDHVTHLIAGDTVLTYERPVIGGGEVGGHDPEQKVDGHLLTEGYLALQSESHPIQFRSVQIRALDP